jgi:plastocyanin
MDGSRSAVPGTALIIAVIAIALSLLTVLSPAQPAPRPAPAAIDLTLLITSSGAIGGPAMNHLFNPQLLVVRRGDTVRLRVMNQSFFRHGIEFAGYGVRTGELNGGASEEISFVADKPGIFEYRCYTPYDPATATCALDHAQMIGHLIVVESGKP